MIAITSTDLNNIFRREVKDPLAGYDDDHPDSESLWKEDEIYQYMTEAIDMVSKIVCGRYRIYQLPVVANQSAIYVPRAVLEIRSARLVTAQLTLIEGNANSYVYRGVDDYGREIISGQGMFSATGSPPTTYIRDYQANCIRLVPIPTTNDTLEVQCNVTDPFMYEAGFPLPVMDTEDQRLILTHMKGRAYMKHDADTEDMVRAKFYMDLFEKDSLDRASRLRNYNRAPGFVQMDW